MTASEEIRSRYRIEGVLEERGITLKGSGSQRTCRCPFHEDGSPSFSVNVDKQVWKCFVGCGEGSVVDLLAKFSGTSPEAFLKDYARTHTVNGKEFKRTNSEHPKDEDPDVLTMTPAAIYSYQNAIGEEVYQVCRYALPGGKKTFRQRHTQHGRFIWNMEGVLRVPYRLPEIYFEETVWIVEGEKDADNLAAIGFQATCNVSGAGKWLDSYSEFLVDKNIVICGDNDEPGKKHVKEVFDSVSKRAKTVKLVAVPAPSKDVSDYIATFSTPDEAAVSIRILAEDAHPYVKGHELPLFTVAELEPYYIRYATNLSKRQVDLSKWLPGLKPSVRPLGPGEMAVIAGGTGVGKTMIIQNIAKKLKDLPTILFEAELSREMMFERSLQVATAVRGDFVESTYAMGDVEGPHNLNIHWPKLLICTISGLTVEKMFEYVKRSELKFGEPPVIVMVDYIQLLRGVGKTRYERYSDISEGLRRLAVETGTVVIVTSQVGRPDEENKNGVGLYDAKESGSIENSSAIHLGVWREHGNKSILYVRVNKATKGGAGTIITCEFDGETNQITQRGVKANNYDPGEPTAPTEAVEPQTEMPMT